MADDLAARSTTATAAFAAKLEAVTPQALTPEAVTVAKQCLLDWIGVALGGRGEPLTGMLIETLGGEGPCGIVGGGRATALNAALINGAMSHALDFDDVINGMGHPTVPVAPVVMALAQECGLSGLQAITAFVAGVETEVRLARLVGPSHYAKGWHSTATLGTFGAMAAAANVLGLKGERLLCAFGLAGTQAAGLKSGFGTMAKPLHPGKAAHGGLLAALLASKGYTADADILGSEQGFVDTQTTTADLAAGLADNPNGWHVVDALFKYHAACYQTHSAIEAMRKLKAEHGLEPADVESVHIQVTPRHMRMCNLQEPRDGLECKFSLRMTAAMALSGDDTSNEKLFNDETAARPDLIALRRRVTVTDDGPELGAVVNITLKDGGTVSAHVDVAVPDRDLAAQQERLERKFHHLADPVVGAAKAAAIIVEVRGLDTAKDLTPLTALAFGDRA